MTECQLPQILLKLDIQKELAKTNGVTFRMKAHYILQLLISVNGRKWDWKLSFK